MATNGTIKVLVVDDSAFMRNAIVKMITTDAEFQVIGTARDGVEAVDKVLSLKPDIVTLDIEMPRMNGLEALRIIMDKHPVPVIVVSALTTEGAKETIEALELGAVDFIPKNLADLSINIFNIKETLLKKLKLIAKKRMNFNRRPSSEAPLSINKKTFEGKRRAAIVSIGASTGGPKVLQKLVPALPAELPVPVVVAQHMPREFTKVFAERLNQLSKLTVKEAEQGEPLSQGTVYIAPGGSHLIVKRQKPLKMMVEIKEPDVNVLYKPSVDLLFSSVADTFGGSTIGVVLTGMGQDGLEGARKIKENGGYIIAQDEQTSVIYGMPRAVVEAGLADKVLPEDEIAGEIINNL
ncbi:MAG: chemotaxis response regulator protein-glutamate methylesterase [Nitrospirae bacterium]|nr:MAG: chemotaxis response regulator protein-glutamate methylesterase [Nitrospirota bacterium]